MRKRYRYIDGKVREVTDDVLEPLPGKRVTIIDREKGIEGTWEHIGAEPTKIRNRAHLREECKKNDCYAAGVFDG